MPLMSQVGRDEICSISRRSFSPAGIDNPIGLRKLSGVRFSFFHCSSTSGGTSFTPSIEAGDGDAAIGIEQAAEHLGQHPDRIARPTAEHARMQVAIGSLDLHLFIEKAAQRWS